MVTIMDTIIIITAIIVLIMDMVVEPMEPIVLTIGQINLQDGIKDHLHLSKE